MVNSICTLDSNNRELPHTMCVVGNMSHVGAIRTWWTIFMKYLFDPQIAIKNRLH